MKKFLNFSNYSKNLKLIECENLSNDLLFVKYDVSNYPVTVVLEESIAKSIPGINSGYICTCNTRDELEELIVSVLTSKRIIKVMQELIRVNQAKKLSEEKEEVSVDEERE